MRNPTFDIMKGIGILAVIVGHCPLPYSLSRLIYVWHMPLFFIVSGYFYKHISLREQCSKSAHALLLPYVATSLLMICIAMGVNCMTPWKDVPNLCLSMLVGGSGSAMPMFQDYTIGCIWFLLGLFWCRLCYTLLDVIQSRGIRLCMVVTLFCGTIWASKYIFIPTQMLSGFNAVLFFAIGQELKQRQIPDSYPQLTMLSAVILVGLSALLGRIDMATCTYPSVIANVLGALAGTYLVYKLADRIRRTHYGVFLSQMGQISIWVLAVHKLEGFVGVGQLVARYLFPEGSGGYMATLLVLRLIIAITLSLWLYRTKFVQWIYFNHR